MQAYTRISLAIGLLIASGSPTVAADDSREDALKKELKKFEGKWSLVAREINGKDALGEEFKRLEVVFDAQGRVYVQKGGEVVSRATVTLDPTKKPRTIDITYTEGDFKGKVYRGIYQIEEGTYKICFTQTGTERPREFTSKPNTDTVLETLKRDKPKEGKER